MQGHGRIDDQQTNGANASCSRTRLLAVAMTCCPRSEDGVVYDYTRQAIESFVVSAGFTEQLHLFCEPGVIDVPTTGDFDMLIHRNATRLGCFANWSSALTWLTLNVQSDAYMILQDDCVWARNSSAEVYSLLRTQRFQGCGFASPYTSAAMVNNEFSGTSDGWFAPELHGDKFWGAVSLMLPHSAAKALLSCERFLGHTHHRRLDVVVGDSMRDLGLPMLVRIPSICDHIGHFSTLGRHKRPENQWARRGFRFERNRD